MADFVENFINAELCVHEGGIVGSVSFAYDDATFEHIVTVGNTICQYSRAKSGHGRGLRAAINDFNETHRKETNETKLS